jgi:hypothetical protein
MSREMSKGDRFQGLLETLVRKHEASYRRHLSALIRGHECELARARHEVHVRRLELACSLRPQVLRSRQRLATWRSKADRACRPNEVDTLRQALNEERLGVAAVHAETRRLQAELAAATSEAGRHQSEADRLHRDIASLQASLTWRWTRPVRAIVSWLRRPGGP